jgi:hypothetical protein
MNFAGYGIASVALGSYVIGNAISTDSLLAIPDSPFASFVSLVRLRGVNM